MSFRHLLRVSSLAATVVASYASFAQGVIVQINGQPSQIRDARVINGYVFVPLRDVVEALGASVQWDENSQTVTVSKGPTVVSMQMGSRMADVNGQSTPLDSAAMTWRGNTMVPARFLSQTLGATVTWDAPSRTIDIESPMASDEMETSSMVSHLTRSKPLAPLQFQDDAPAWLNTGKSVHFTLDATPGGTAAVVMPGLSAEIPMQETSSGHYEATWSPGANSQMATVRSASVMAKITIDDNTYYSTAKSDINFDNDPPVISSMVPTDSATISGFKPVVSVSFYDSGSGIDKSKVSMSLNGQDVTQSTEIMSQGIRYALPDDLTPGKYTVHLNITDKAGNTTSRDWTFGVTGSTATSMFTHDGDATLRPGQPVNFSLRAVPGSQVSVQIGGMPPFPLTETSPGVFSGIYTIRDRDHFGGDIVTATILPPNAEQYTIQSLQRMGVSGNISPESMAPVISSPLASQTLTDDPLIIGGSAPAASTVEIHVTYSTALNAHTSINSAIADITVVADTAGNFQTKPLHIPRLRGSMPMVTITATTVLPDGTRSPNTMLVLHGGR